MPGEERNSGAKSMSKISPGVKVHTSGRPAHLMWPQSKEVIMNHLFQSTQIYKNQSIKQE
jgi:hypothetical protein